MTLVGNLASFNIAYQGLSGPASAAHLHGPASDAETAGVLVDLAEFNGGGFDAAGGIHSTTGSQPLLVPLIVGRASYVNVHTEANPSGEARGQIHH